MNNLPVIQDDNLDLETCTKCGGKCCQSMPGSTLPEDFGAPDEFELRARVRNALESGRWAIDWWEDDPPMYYVRPAVKGHEGEITHDSWGGTCTFLTKQGCDIFDVRPSGCRGLRPYSMTESGNCEPTSASKYQAAQAWMPYNGMLKDLLVELEGDE